MAKQLLVDGDKKFKITVPDNSVITFGPWSPPTEKTRAYGDTGESKRGTLRIYGRTKATVLAVFSGVKGFRDLSIGYAEEVAREEGAVIWKDDEKGYVRDEKVSRTRTWIEPEVPALGSGVDEDAEGVVTGEELF